MNQNQRIINTASHAPTQGELPGETIKLRNREFLIRCLLTKIGNPRLKAHFLALAMWAVTYETVNDVGFVYAPRSNLMASLGHTRRVTFATQNNRLEALERLKRTNDGRGCRFTITPSAAEFEPPTVIRTPNSWGPITGKRGALRDEIAQATLEAECATWHQKTHLTRMAAAIIAFGEEDGTLTINRNELARNSGGSPPNQVERTEPRTGATGTHGVRAT